MYYFESLNGVFLCIKLLLWLLKDFNVKLYCVFEKKKYIVVFGKCNIVCLGCYMVLSEMDLKWWFIIDVGVLIYVVGYFYWGVVRIEDKLINGFWSCLIGRGIG